MKRLRFTALVVALVTVAAITPAGWARTQNKPGPSARQKTLLVVDLRKVSVDDQMAFTALQGIVNRSSPRIYYVGLAGGQDYVTDPTGDVWLRDVVDLPVSRIADPFELFRLFRKVVRGLVVWDPALKVDTQNVATTMAGLQSLIPVSPDLSSALRRAPYRFTVTKDLRDEAFGSRSEAYEWALDELGPPEQYGLLAWIGGTRNFVPVGQPGLRDLVVARKGFAFEVEPIRESDLAERILEAFPSGMDVYGYPFVDDVVYETTATYGPIVQAPGEPVGVTQISRSGKQLIPSTDSANLTVHGSFEPVEQHPVWDDSPRTPDAGKTYVSFVITDGDNLGWNQQRLRFHHWDDKLRGTIPIGVSISPFLATHAPRMYDYYLHTATKNEVFVAGPSGAGYAYPGYHADLDGYLKRTKSLMDLAGLPSVWILDYGYAASPTTATTERYAEALRPSAIFADYGGWILPNPPEISFSGDTPVLHAAWGENIDNTVSRIRGASFLQRTRGQSAAFVFVALVTSAMSFGQAKEVMARLAPLGSYEAMRPDHLVGLIKGERASGTLFPPG